MTRLDGWDFGASPILVPTGTRERCEASSTLTGNGGWTRVASRCRRCGGSLPAIRCSGSPRSHWPAPRWQHLVAGDRQVPPAEATSTGDSAPRRGNVMKHQIAGPTDIDGSRPGRPARPAAMIAGTPQGVAASGEPESAVSSVAIRSRPRVISDWNATAVSSLVTEALRSPCGVYVYFGFVHAACTTQCNGITGDYRPVQVGRGGSALRRHLRRRRERRISPAAELLPRLEATPRLPLYAASLAGVPAWLGRERRCPVRQAGCSAHHRPSGQRRRYAPRSSRCRRHQVSGGPTADPPRAVSTPSAVPDDASRPTGFGPVPTAYRPRRSPQRSTRASTARSSASVGTTQGGRSARTRRADADREVLLRHRSRRIAGCPP